MSAVRRLLNHLLKVPEHEETAVASLDRQPPEIVQLTCGAQVGAEELEWKDNVKARIIDKAQTNPYRPGKKGARKVRSQAAWYERLKAAAKQ